MKLTKTSGSEFGGQLWRNLTLQRKLQYRCTTTVPHVHNSSKKCLGKFTYCMTCGAHKLVHSEPFLDYLYDLWHCCQRYIATCWKKILYRCTSTFSRLNYYGSILFKSHSYLYEVVRTNFYANFWTFCNFRPQFGENWGPWDGNANSLGLLKVQSLLKKTENGIKIDPQTVTQYLFKICVPRTTAHRQTGVRQTKKNKQK